MKAREIFDEQLTSQINDVRKAGTYKAERILTGPQSGSITVSSSDKPVVNFCANNYLGLSNSEELREAAKAAINEFGFGLSSVRFICGTQTIHKKLEEKISSFYGSEDTILYSSCFDANAGLFEALLTNEDAIISDSLNHGMSTSQAPASTPSLTQPPSSTVSVSARLSVIATSTWT